MNNCMKKCDKSLVFNELNNIWNVSNGLIAMYCYYRMSGHHPSKLINYVTWILGLIYNGVMQLLNERRSPVIKLKNGYRDLRKYYIRF
jgi:hypothetical protein